MVDGQTEEQTTQNFYFGALFPWFDNTSESPRRELLRETPLSEVGMDGCVNVYGTWSLPNLAFPGLFPFALPLVVWSILPKS